MIIPHVSKQKTGWFYWDFPLDSNDQTLINIFVKGKFYSLFMKHMQPDLFPVDDKIESGLDILCEPFLTKLKSELWLNATCSFFAKFKKEMKVKIPPPQEILIPIQNIWTVKCIVTDEPSLKYFNLRYRLEETSTTHVFYHLVGKWKLERVG